MLKHNKKPENKIRCRRGTDNGKWGGLDMTKIYHIQVQNGITEPIVCN